MASLLESHNILFLDKVFLKGKKCTAVTGAERFNLHWIKELAHLGNHISVYATKCWSEDIESICKSANVKHYKLSKLVRVAWPKAIISSLRLLFIDKKPYDTIIMGNVGRIILPVVRLIRFRFPKTKLILMAHREPTPLYLKILAGMDLRVIAVNNKIAEGFTNAGYKDVQVYFGEIRKTHFFSKKKSVKENRIFNFCVFGNLDPEWKGSDVAAEAFSNLPHEIKANAKLHLAGYFGKIPKFEDKNIITYPWMPEEEVPQFLSSMDVAIVPSRDRVVMKETFSQASVQAMLAGLPLIVNNLPVLVEKVENGGGLIFSDTKELTQHMILLYQNPKLREEMSIKSRSEANSRFTWSTEYFVEQFLRN